MNRNGLVLHCGAHAVEEDVLRAATTPVRTYRGEKRQRAFYPIPHAALLDCALENLESAGYQTVERAHALTRNGERYFGLLRLHHVDQALTDRALVVGLRNAHDGSFAAHLSVGASVFVCDNLSFSGEVCVSRAHTRHIARDLPFLMCKAIGQLGEQRQLQERRFQAYHNRDLERRDAHSLILRALLAGVIGEQRVLDVATEWEAPRHEEFVPRNAWSLFNAFTEVLKPRQREGAPPAGSNLATLAGRTQKLHGLFDCACGLNLG